MATRIDRLNELLKQSPGDAFIRFALAKEYEKQGKLKLAVSLLRDMLSDNPDYLAAYYHLGMLLMRDDGVEEACDVLDRGIELARSTKDHHTLGELLQARSMAAPEEEEE